MPPANGLSESDQCEQGGIPDSIKMINENKEESTGQNSGCQKQTCECEQEFLERICAWKDWLRLQQCERSECYRSIN